jgi:hypothetical protein
MPSDARTTAAVAALAPVRDRFRSALAATLEEVRAWLDSHRSTAGDQVAQLATELGPVGARYVDAGKLSAALGLEPDAAPAAHGVIGRALTVLVAMSEAADDAWVVELNAGVNLYRAVDIQLASLGRAMGAARVVDLARSGRYNPAVHDAWLEAFPFGLWSQAERELAPPVVVELAGADLRATALAEFLDGGVKIVLVARGETSPAPLVRLVAPRTFVAQDPEAAVVSRLAAWNGPGIAALLPNGAARFVHDPSQAGGLAGRLAVRDVPALDPKRRAGPFTVAQQREELEQLKALQSAASAASLEPAGSAGPPGAAASAADKLAAWLLQQADLAGT